MLLLSFILYTETSQKILANLLLHLLIKKMNQSSLALTKAQNTEIYDNIYYTGQKF